MGREHNFEIGGYTKELLPIHPRGRFFRSTFFVLLGQRTTFNYLKRSSNRTLSHGKEI